MTIAASTLVLAVRRRERPVRELGPAIWAAELAELAAEGFEAIDLVDSWLAPGELDESELRDLRAAIAAAGVELAGVSVIRRSVVDPQDGEANLAFTLRSVEAAAALGAPIVSIGFHRPLTPEQRAAPFWMVDAPDDARDEATWQLAIDRVGEVAAHARSLGLGVALEMHERTLLDSSAGVLRIVEGVGADNLGVNPDVGNLVRVPHPLVETWEDTLRAVLPHTTYWHVKNYTRLEHPASGLVLSAPSELAAGVVDYRMAIRDALAVGFAGPICIEHYGGDGLGVIARGRAYVEDVLRRGVAALEEAPA